MVQILHKDFICGNVTGEPCFLKNSELAIEWQQVAPGGQTVGNKYKCVTE